MVSWVLNFGYCSVLDLMASEEAVPILASVRRVKPGVIRILLTTITRP